MTEISTRGRQAIATALVAAPLLLLAANIVHPSHGLDAESWLSSAAAGQTRFYAGHVLFLAAAATLILAVLALVYTLRESRSALAWIGGGLTALGALGLTGLVSLDFVVWQMAGLAGALAAVTIQPMAIAGSLRALVGLVSVARSLLRVGALSSGTMSPSAWARLEAR
jgi:hypothetical protein